MKIFKFFSVLALSLSIFTATNARTVEHVPGQLLIQVNSKADLQQIVNDLAVVDGMNTQLRINGIVSAPMKVWLISFNETIIDDNLMLEIVNSHALTKVVQFNHVVSLRTTPNDAQFTSQWQYINTGANGGTIDGDIDADSAWDITTGGLTMLGDSIVVCALDDGIDMNHLDFGDNRWINYAEIPNNNIDDDLNGYVDDYDGWNSEDSNDNIAGGGHGTPVAGIMGAQGDNGTGVTGVNWDVKVMVIKNDFNTVESEVLAAYTYPLVMRQMYNATDGAEGAFVVSTNASWGVDFGQPSSAPLWCAMYDTLGAYGILSCGATINGNQNVDLVGDLPTACPSDFLISVTNCDNTDNKVTNAGYGAVTIDLGAHGAGAFTTSQGGGYGGFGGTSGATPHVTGAIGLLYSAPCSGLITLAKSDPAQAALDVKQYILDGVDPNTSLAGITTTGGRLNLHKALLELLNDCDSSACIAPYSLAASGVTDSSATLTWNSISDSTYTIQYKLTSSSTWITITDTAQSILLGSLQACSEYEFRVAVQCDTSVSSYSNPVVFKTDRCCVAPSSLVATSPTATDVSLNWNDVLAAVNYSVQYRDTSSAVWTIVNGLSASPFSLTGLDSCTVYEVAIGTNCDTGATIFGNPTLFATTACGACIDLPYCNSISNNATEEWISNVTIGSINNTTMSDGGYGDYTHLSTMLTQGSSYAISLTPDFNSFQYDEYFRVWIDYNQDGDFGDVGELVFDPNTAATNTITGNISIPATATLGTTRMRVSMKYNSTSTECETAGSFGFGAVEDYCVFIDFGTGTE
ncbi:MAG: S8 family serine peptidase, partial [Bacteroidia bacterium]|nr:S8 family serine peptidase [Bacteroidia bacterium]